MPTKISHRLPSINLSSLSTERKRDHCHFYDNFEHNGLLPTKRRVNVDSYHPPRGQSSNDGFPSNECGDDNNNKNIDGDDNDDEHITACNDVNNANDGVESDFEEDDDDEEDDDNEDDLSYDDEDDDNEDDEYAPNPSESNGDTFGEFERATRSVQNINSTHRHTITFPSSSSIRYGIRYCQDFDQISDQASDSSSKVVFFPSIPVGEYVYVCKRLPVGRDFSPVLKSDEDINDCGNPSDDQFSSTHLSHCERESKLFPVLESEIESRDSNYTSNEICDSDSSASSLSSLGLSRLGLDSSEEESESKPTRLPAIIEDENKDLFRLFVDNSHYDLSNTPTLGSLGLSRLEIKSSKSHSDTESTRLPVVIEEDRKLFKLIVDDEGNTELHLSVLDDEESTIVDNIRKATKFDDLNVPNFRGRTVLHLAVMSRRASLVRVLMCAGACVSVDDVEGNTPLHLACSLGDTDVVAELTRPIDYTETLDNTYYLPFTAIPQNLAWPNKDGKTCLQLACLNGHVNVYNQLKQFIL